MMLMVRSAFIIPENAEKGFVHARAKKHLNVFFCPAVFA